VRAVLSAIASLFRSRPSDAEKALLHRCAGDKTQMERLIGHEQRRRPDLSRSAASRNALDRWSRDR
jgi:hypothetical protein